MCRGLCRGRILLSLKNPISFILNCSVLVALFVPVVVLTYFGLVYSPTRRR